MGQWYSQLCSPPRPVWTEDKIPDLHGKVMIVTGETLPPTRDTMSCSAIVIDTDNRTVTVVIRGQFGDRKADMRSPLSEGCQGLPGM